MNNKEKIEKTTKKNSENISGGYVGKDWGKEYNDTLFKLGINHEKHLLHGDKYFYKGEEISREEAFGMVAKWRRKHGGK